MRIIYFTIVVLSIFALPTYQQNSCTYPCLNGGTLTLNSTSNTCYCKCSAAYTGSYCQTATATNATTLSTNCMDVDTAVCVYHMSTNSTLCTSGSINGQSFRVYCTKACGFCASTTTTLPTTTVTGNSGIGIPACTDVYPVICATWVSLGYCSLTQNLCMKSCKSQLNLTVCT